jgi:Secretion system C-terminal sorting domain
MKIISLILVLFVGIQLYSQDLNWNTSAIPDNSTSFNFGSIGSPASNVTYAVTGPGTITTGPLRFTTAQGDGAWRTAITFAAVLDLKVYTLTFNSAVCGLSFIIYDIDGDNTNGDRAIVTANNSGNPQNITMTALDPGFAGGPPTITGSGTPTATGTGTQGNQTDDRIQVTITGCVSTLTIQYGNNPTGGTGGRSFSIGNLSWSTNTLPVNFLTFSGQKTAANSVQLKWSTASEVNAGRYEIERSTDGQSFLSTGFVPALNQAGNYSFSDYTPAQGTLFYRIKQIDIDGQFQYSTVIALKFDAGAQKGITIFPNPAINSVFVTTNNNTLIEKIQFFDTNGRSVFQKQGTANKIDISTLSKGLYRIKVTDKSGKISAGTFIKQ